MTYERLTALPIRDVLSRAEQVLTERIPIKKIAEDRHSIRLSGGDGTATIHVHKHGLQTVVTVETDQVRTSRLDGEVQYFLTLLPYQPGDVKTTAEVAPGGLSRGGA
jgi:hypothetical protein